MWVAMFLVEWLLDLFGRYRVLQQGSILVVPQFSEPEPDVAVLREPFNRIDGKAKPEDILLLIEVADTTLETDTSVKKALYARSGISDYWVVDIQHRRVLVYRRPAVISVPEDGRELVTGRFRYAAEYGENQTVSPLAAPHASFSVKDIFLDLPN